jgi:hypothetical protein
MPSRAPRGPDVDQRHGERRRLQDRDALTCWVGWWAWEELNLRLHPYQQSRAYRCATRRFCRSCATVKGQVMRSNDPARPAYGQDTAAAGRVGDQLVAGKVMGLPGGRGSPIERRDRGQAACPTPALRLARLATSTANPPASTRAAASTPSEGMSQLGCPLGSAGGTGALVGWRQASPTWASVGGYRVSSATVGCSAAT